MENEIFAALAPYGFQVVNENICVGTWQDYAVTLRKFSRKIYYVYTAVRLPKGSMKLRRQLNKALNQPGIHFGAVEQVMPNFITYSISFPKSEDPAVCFREKMDRYIRILREAGVSPADTCAITGAPNPDSLCFLARNDFYGYQPVCAAAIRQEGQTLQEKVEENQNNGSYLTGLVGALLGAVVGIAANLLTIVLLQRIFSLLFALVPVGAMFGYKLFKGRMDKLAIGIVLVLSVLAVPVMEFLATAISLAREYSVPMGDSLSLVSKAFFQPEILKETGPEMLKMLFFMALDIFIAYGYMKGQLNSTQTGTAQLQTDTLRPNPRYNPNQTNF